MKLQRKGERYIIKTKPRLPAFLVPSVLHLEDLLSGKPGRIIRYDGP